MTLFQKFLAVMLVIVGTMLAVGVVGSQFFAQRERDFIHTTGEDVQGRLMQGVALTSRGALNEATVVARDPAVLAILSGLPAQDATDPLDPVLAQARADLRAHLGGLRAGWKSQFDGKDLRVHIHTPFSRSLLRAWDDKQKKSDELKSFRMTVNQIAKEHKPIQGIEVGRGGFVIRGIAPAITPDGRYLGSVEVLEDFDVLAEPLPGDVSIYMKKELLEIATALQDPAKNPVLADRYVQVSKEGEWVPSAEFLTQGAAELVVATDAHLNHVAFPILDWNSESIGAAVVSFPPTPLQNGIATAKLGGAFLIFFAFVFVGGAGYWLIQINVLRPVTQMTKIAKEIADNRADLNHRIQVARKDELGELAGGFNRILDRIVAVSREAQVLADHLQQLPMPILKMDRNFQVTYLNQSALNLIARPMNEVIGKRCYDLLKSGACHRNCAIERCMASKAIVTDETRVGLTQGNANLPVQYTGLPLLNAKGEVEGAVEVLIDLSRLYSILGEVKGVSSTVLEASKDLDTSSASLDSRASTMGAATAHGERAVEELSANLGEITSAAVEMTVAVNSVASAVEEMTSTIAEVARSTATTSEVANQVNERTQIAASAIASLKKSADSIDKVADVISSVASQTNLLALNASIEAASAGEAGKGFAVVATEVKALANRTKAATGEIRMQIERIQADTLRAVQTMEAVSSGIGEVANLSRSVATAVEEQSAALREIANSTSQVSALADGVSEQVTIAYEHSNAVAVEIRTVSSGVEQNAKDIATTRKQSSGLAMLASQLRDSLKGFRLL